MSARQTSGACRGVLAGCLCSAVLEYAENETGIVERARPGDPFALRIRVRGAVARVSLDPETRTIFVWRLYAA